ncbi:hypothetical protein Sru01_15990 [Sphaerisporangium rufum]|uniref:Protein kinase domain-containing protein n=1 Tax=Sphaerisporangium rufum TaxID=1381558 RepID=A0A919UZS2_9ACTN|nr:hypothetical protein Sru01_15990 [Sphaerisporangium rufum]
MKRGSGQAGSPGHAPGDGGPWEVGGYRILRRLGEGGMGVVYLAEGRSRRQVAIKVIHRHLASDPDFRRRFRREVAATRRVARFSTAPVLDADVDGELAYLVTEYVPGPTLLEKVHREGPLSGSALDGLAMSMATALRAVHAAEVIHRDLKPSNVLLSPVGPKVIDFGLASLPDGATHSVTIMGTPAYMSPERVRGLTITPASDVFSWAGVVVFAACGRPPFGTGAGHEVLYRVVHDPPELPPLDGVLGELVVRALDKDPASRPTPAELVDALATRAGVPEPNAPTAPADPAPPAAPPAPRRRAHRLRWAGAGTALAVLITAGTVAATRAGLAELPILPGVPAEAAGRAPLAPDTGTTGTPAPTGRPFPIRDGRANPLRARNVRFYVQPGTDAARQADTWTAQGRPADAALMRSLAAVPQAMWLDGGSPDDMARRAREATTEAAARHQVPVFVTNHIPGRDCWNGGAPDSGAYRAWIEGVARGIGDRPAVVVLEPNSLSRPPGTAECPKGGEEAARRRYADLSTAVSALAGLRRTAVYLDGGLAGWPELDEIADRLLAAGLRRADGFHLNMTAHRDTQRSLAHGRALARCLYLKAGVPETGCAPEEIAAVHGDAPGLPHFVVDTSRNGAGEWTPPKGRFPSPDEWCNPPGRGAGPRPTTGTGDPAADAFLWLNSPGFSNGQCTRGTAGPADPVYGFVTPQAGQWWPDRALEMARNAVPPLAGGPR